MLIEFGCKDTAFLSKNIMQVPLFLYMMFILLFLFCFSLFIFKFAHRSRPGKS